MWWKNQLIGGGFGGKRMCLCSISPALAAEVQSSGEGQIHPSGILIFSIESAMLWKVPSPWAVMRMVSSPVWTVRSQLRYRCLCISLRTGSGRACTHSVGPYCYQNADIRGYGYYTNNPPAGAFRGFGVCQSEFALESLINVLAEKVGITPGRSATATPSSRARCFRTARLRTAPPL